MTLTLIQKEHPDNNDYELWLQGFGYIELDEHLKQDVLAICKFLCTEELVMQGLQKLANHFFAFNRSERKTLRQFFDEWGSNNYFNNPNSLNGLDEFKTSTNFHYPKATPILYGELTTNLFNNVLLKNGYLSADIGAGPKHGKWAHTIQFFLIEEARKEGVLTLHAPNTCQLVQTISQSKGTYDSFSLWNLLFDSFDDHIFTNPNNITTVLTHYSGNAEAEIFLASKLEAYEKKFDKAASTSGSYEGLAQIKYLSRLSEASYVSYKEKCGLLWFAPKSKDCDKSSIKNRSGFEPNI